MTSKHSYSYIDAKQFNRIFYSGLASILAITFTSIMITAHRLDQQTRQQCASQNWPANAADAHKAFCKAYLK